MLVLPGIVTMVLMAITYLVIVRFAGNQVLSLPLFLSLTPPPPTPTTWAFSSIDLETFE